MDYAENPQITYLRDAYEAKVKECEELKDALDGLNDDYSREKCRLLASRNSVKELEARCEELQTELLKKEEIIEELEEDMEFFNALPWYERLLFKFDVQW